MEMTQKQSLGRNLWHSITPILGYSFCQLLPTTFVFMVMVIHEVWLAENGNAIFDTSFFEGIIYSIAFIISGFIYTLFIRSEWKSTKEQLPKYEHKYNVYKLAFTVFFTYFGIKTLVISLISLSGLLNYFPSDRVDTMSQGSAIMHFIAAVIVAPVVEEICFRGFVQNRIMSWMKPKYAVVFQALIFGIIHGNQLQMLTASISGLMLGLLYMRYRQIWPCIIGHMAFNFFASVFNHIPSIDIALILVQMLIIGLILTFVGGFLLLKQPAAVPVFDNQNDSIYEL